MRLRSPKLRTRPASVATGLDFGDYCSKGSGADSEDDNILNEMAKEGAADKNSTLFLMAENFKKLEKSGKLRSWNLGKLKAAASSRASFTLGKFSRSYSSLTKRSKPDSSPQVKRRNGEPEPEIDSDNDSDSGGATSSTPLLDSAMSTPPPKPPRTFKTKKLDIGPVASDVTISTSIPSEEDFTSGVLSAIKEMGSVCDSTITEEERDHTRANGDVPTLSGVANGAIMMGRLAEDSPKRPLSQRSEDSEVSGEIPSDVPTSSRSESIESELKGEQAVEIKQESGEAITQKATDTKENGDKEITMATPVSSEEMKEDAADSNVGAEDESDLGDEPKPDPDSEEPAAMDDPQEDDIDITPTIKRRKEGITPQGHLKLPPFMNTCETSTGEVLILFSEDKRMSILSVAETEWFSPESSISSPTDSKRGSISASPDLHESTSSVQGFQVSSSASECFSTPPSSPPLANFSQQLEAVPESNPSTPDIPDDEVKDSDVFTSSEQTNQMEDSSQVTNQIEDGSQVTNQMEEVTNQTEEVTNQVEDSGQVTNQETDLSPVTPKITETTERKRIEDVDSASPESRLPVIEKRPVTRRPPKSSEVPRRKRSLTVTNQHQLELLEARDSVGDLYPRSKDDNFNTECGHKYHDTLETSSLVSSFSAQDLQDIFGQTLPTLTVEPVEPVEDAATDNAVGGSSEMDRSGTTHAGSTEELNDADCSSVGEEADREKLRTPSSLGSRTTTPETIEAVVIPDSITPDVVSHVLLCVSLCVCVRVCVHVTVHM